MHFTILGYGVEGQSTLKYLQKKHPEASFEVRDEKVIENFPEEIPGIFGSDFLKNLDTASTIFRSPAILPYRIYEANPHHTPQSFKITSQTIEFFNHCPGTIIGVTGTKGKGTTCSLIAEILKNTKEKVFLLGNIGSPAFDQLDEITMGDFVVYELSSFQLYDLQKGPSIAVLLNITPDHLDVHRDLEEYVHAKTNIISTQTHKDHSIINAKQTLKKIDFSIGGNSQRVFFDTEHIERFIHIGNYEIETSKLLLIGKFNYENIVPALEVSKILNLPKDIVEKTVYEFKGLEHRLEDCGIINGRIFINNSFGTTPDTTIAALSAFEGKPITLFLGGSDKGANFTELAEAISKANIASIISIPPMGQKILEKLTSIPPQTSDFRLQTFSYTNMPSAIQWAFDHTPEGGIILMAPGCASFGCFENYKERGRMFKEAVEELMSVE